MKSFHLFCINILIAYSLGAQVFGGNPASLHWKQINTDSVRIIFPESLSVYAQRIASVTQKQEQAGFHRLGNGFRKVNIVLQNQTMLSNAYVSLAPFRSEFYTSPAQQLFQLGAVNWLDNLSLHEFRHVQQYNNFNKGFSNFASVILGEQGQQIANAMAIPDWFFEGDAVYNETILSEQGRGRLPLFLAGYQSLFAAGKDYAYMKWRNGSMRDYVPNHYQLGYLLVAYGNHQYGNEIWQKVTDDAARFKPFFYPFQGAVKKHTGSSFAQFTNDAIGYYKKQWDAKDGIVDWLTTLVKNDVTDYQFPYMAEDGSVIAVGMSKKNIPAFVKIKEDGTVQKIAPKDISQDPYFSYRNGKIIYTNYQPDSRWGNRDYSNIKIVDVSNGAETTIRSHTKYATPDISADGKTILAVELNPDQSSSMVWLNLLGQVEGAFRKEGIVFSQPKFSKEGHGFFVAERKDDGEMALKKYAANNQTEPRVILDFSNRIIGNLNVQGDTLLFTTTYRGRDELWAYIDEPGKEGPYRMASYATGIYQGAINAKGNIIGTLFTANGYRLASLKPLWERTALRDELKLLYLPDSMDRAGYGFLKEIKLAGYQESRYRKSFQLFKMHSYRPFYEQPEYSFTVYGQNVLNTFQSEIAYTYNENEGSHKLGYNGIYGGTYLQPIFGIGQTWQRTAAINKDTLVNWNETVGYAGLQLPLNFTGGDFFRFLTIRATYHIDNIKWTGLGEKLFTNRNFSYLQTSIAYTSQMQKAEQHIYPHFAESFLLQYKTAVNRYRANQVLASGTIYMPGIGKNHNLVINGAYQTRDTLQQYLFANNFPFSRGYTAIDFPRTWKIGLNYHLPLAYPDWGFGQIVYFLRIRSNLFFDYTEGKSLRTGTVFPFRSLGTELFFDTKWWNQQPLSFGIRYSRLLDNEFRGSTQPDRWEFILPVNLLK
ncbi:MAG: hypothetical protein RLZZ28_1675 [Bacteroidota bacterium]